MNVRRASASWLILLCLLVPGAAISSDEAAEERSPGKEVLAIPPEMAMISLVHGAFDPLRSALSIPPEYQLREGATTSYYLVQLVGPVESGWTSTLERRGRIAAYIPHNSYLMQLPGPADLEAARTLDFVRAVVPYQPYFKMQPQLIRATGEQRILANLYPWEPESLVVAAARAVGGRILSMERSEWQTTLEMNLPSSGLPALAAREEVRYLQSYSDPSFANGQAQWVTQSGVQDKRPIWDKGLRGERMVVGVGDSGLDWDHSFFRDPGGKQPGPGHRKVIGVKDWASGQGDKNGHGTHVAGSVAGNDAPVSGTSINDGQAPEAFLYIDHISNGDSDWQAPKDHNVLLQGSYDTNNSGTGEGARLHSNSWGYTEGGGYDQAAMTNDQFAWSHKDFLPVWLAGNSRSNGANSIWTGGNSKNVITIGATQNGASMDSMATFSSLGPLNDKRMKPTVCTPGVSIVSSDADSSLTSNNNGEAPGSGTSMATPTAAGNMALIRQYYKEGWYPTGKKNAADGFAPSAALMKATAATGATEMKGSGTDYNNEGKYPNNSQGFGRMTLDASLYFEGDALRMIAFDERQGGLDTGANRSYNIQVKSDSQPFRVMLVWTDYPAALNANPQIVNDLDLEVIGTGGSYRGNNFQGKNPGHSVPGGSFDRVNVEEAVFLPDAANGLVAGAYTIRVRAQNVPQGPQPYAVVVIGDVEAGGGQTVASVMVDPPVAEVEVGKSVVFGARALDASGADVPGVTFQYAVSPASAGSPQDLGAGNVEFRAGTTPGSAALQATASGRSGSASITIKAGSAARIETAKEITLEAGSSRQVSAKVFDQYDNELASATVDWSVAGPVGQFAPSSGSSVQFTAATKIGTGTFGAASGAAMAGGSVTVVPGPPAKVVVTPASVEMDVGASVDLTAEVFDKYDNPIKNGTVRWDPPSFATLAPTTGYKVKLSSAGPGGSEGVVKVTAEAASADVPVKLRAAGDPGPGPGPGPGGGAGSGFGALMSDPMVWLLIALVVVGLAVAALVARRRKSGRGPHPKDPPPELWPQGGPPFR